MTRNLSLVETASRRLTSIVAAITLCTALPFASTNAARADEPASENDVDAAAAEAAENENEEANKPLPLFDGKSLKGWKITNFGGEGEVTIKDKQIILGMGNDLTGITTTRKKLPTSNYEVTLEAMRVEGNDFFCGLTFPVRKGFLTLILGGWGGGLCGLSSIGGYDASENETGGYREFANDKWYKIRLRVTDKRIDAWVDDDKIVSHTIDKRRLDVRLEVELSKPFGFSTWRTTGALRNIQLRRLSDEEVKQADAKSSR